MRVDQQIFALDISVDDAVLMHEEKAVHDLLHEELELRLAEHDLLSAQDAVQVEVNVLEDQVDGLALAAHDIDELDDVGVALERIKLLQHFDLTDGRDGETVVVLLLHFYLFERVELVADLGAVHFAEGALVDELFLFEYFRRTQFHF